MASLIFEGVVAALLVIVAVMALRLDARLRALRSGQDGVRASVAELAQATAQAQAGIRALRAAGEEAGRDLEPKLRAARERAEELRLMIDASDARINRIVEARAEPAPKRCPEPEALRHSAPERDTDRAERLSALSRLR
ncbi:MAG: DUF6468 domain-containing protein [Maricaulaceae bacterium]